MVRNNGLTGVLYFIAANRLLFVALRLDSTRRAKRQDINLPTAPQMHTATLMTLIVMWAHDIRDHKWLALRAILVGWTALICPWIVTGRLVFLDDWLFVTGITDIRRFWPDPRHPFFHFLIGGSVNAAAAWIVGRFHREQWTSMVLVFFASLLLISDLPEFIPAAISAWGPGHERFWGIVILDFIFMRLPIVALGIWGARRLPRESMNSKQ